MADEKYFEKYYRKQDESTKKHTLKVLLIIIKPFWQMSRQGSDLGMPGGLTGSEAGAGSGALRKRALTHSSSGEPFLIHLKTKPARAIQLQSHFTFYDPQNFLLNPLLESPTQTALSIVNLLTTFTLTFNFSYSLVNLPRASSLYGSTSNLLFSFTFTF